MINRVVLVGRMTRDPELRRTGNGTAVTSFTLALDRGFTTQDGQSADFIPCVVWNKAAESTAQYCHKGSLVGVDGSLRSRNYTNNQGQKVYVVEVMCNSVKFLESRREAEARPQGSYNNQSSYTNNNSYNNQNAFGNQQNNYSNQQNTFNNQSNNTNRQNNFYDTNSTQVDLDKDFGDDVNAYDIMDDDIQF